MPRPAVLILRAPGANCDEEAAYAFQKAGAAPERVHINRLLETPALLDRYQILTVPGGFTYGDDIAAGKILATQIRHHLADAVRRFRDSGKLILGICNGFQVLLKAGLFFDDSSDFGSHAAGAAACPPATLTYNDSGKFEDRWIHLRSDAGPCVFLAGIERLYLPVAHGEGKFVYRDDATLRRMQANRQLVLRYTAGDRSAALPLDPDPFTRTPYPHNPNGSLADIAGICDSTGRVLGLMPHPERHVEPTQHPQWTRRGLAAEGDGLAVFRNAVRYFA